jgi:hypothetical protein
MQPAAQAPAACTNTVRALTAVPMFLKPDPHAPAGAR